MLEGRAWMELVYLCSSFLGGDQMGSIYSYSRILDSFIDTLVEFGDLGIY